MIHLGWEIQCLPYAGFLNTEVGTDTEYFKHQIFLKNVIGNFSWHQKENTLFGRVISTTQFPLIMFAIIEKLF